MSNDNLALPEDSIGRGLTPLQQRLLEEAIQSSSNSLGNTVDLQDEYDEKEEEVEDRFQETDVPPTNNNESMTMAAIDDDDLDEKLIISVFSDELDIDETLKGFAKVVSVRGENSSWVQAAPSIIHNAISSLEMKQVTG
jgi:hypothetical protein